MSNQVRSFGAWNPSLCSFSIILFLSLFPLVLLIIALIQVTDTLMRLHLIIIGALIAAILVSMMGLVEVSNEGSISGMVAQRGLKVAYLTTLCMAALVFYLASFIISGGIARTLLNEGNINWVVVIAALSPIFSILILIFPLSVVKTAEELGFVPETFNLYYESENEHKQVYRPISNIRDGMSKEEIILEFETEIKLREAEQLKERYRVYFHIPPCSSHSEWNKKFHQITHYSCISIGVTLGYVSIFNHITTSRFGYSIIFEIALVSISMLAMVAFFILRAFKKFLKEKSGYNYMILKSNLMKCSILCEFTGLYYYIVCLTLVSVVAGEIVDFSFD